MSFTNQMLGALGTATGALTAGKHIAEQKKANEVAEAANAIAKENQRIASNQEITELKEQVEDARVAVAGVDSKEAQEALDKAKSNESLFTK